MVLPTSGQLSFEQIRTEFGGSGAIPMSAYYQGGSLVPYSNENSSLPTSTGNETTVPADFWATDGYGSGTGIVIVPQSTGGKMASIAYQPSISLGTCSQSNCTYGSTKLTITEFTNGFGMFSCRVSTYGTSQGSSTALQGANVTTKTSSFSGPTVGYSTAGFGAGSGPNTETGGYYVNKSYYSFSALTQLGTALSAGTTYYITFT